MADVDGLEDLLFDALYDCNIGMGVATRRAAKACVAAIEANFLAMEAARQPQLPSDDGLIKALEDLFAGGFIEAGTRLEGQWASELVVRLKPLREALSRHKAPLSVAGDDVERLIEARKVVAKEYRRLGLNPNPVLRGDFDAGVEVQAALRSQYNKVSKP